MPQNVFIVCLRQPTKLQDSREDPYWEAGSFGCTRCHRSNLLHPKTRHISDGDRLAFTQGGPQGTRLVFLTPGVRVIDRGDILEIRWKPTMPFRYADAPLLVDKRGRTDFPRFKSFVAASKSKHWSHKLSSKCRSRAKPLPEDVATEMMAKFNTRWAGASSEMICKTYLEAVPGSPSWEEQRKKDPWKRKDREVEYYESYGDGVAKSRSCARKRC